MTVLPHIDLISLFMLGLLGTGHCIGMCGPLVVALPGQFGGWSAHLIYHLGRVTTYSLVGAGLGIAGSGLRHLAHAQAADPLTWIARIQVGMSIFAAAFLLAFGLTRLGLLREPSWMAVATPRNIPGYRRTMDGVLNRKSRWWLLGMGLIMGLLPCGLSYAAFARALAADSLLAGFSMVFAFGLGTLPGLLLVGSGAAAIIRRFRLQTEMIAGLIMIGMAVKLLADAWIRSA